MAKRKKNENGNADDDSNKSLAIIPFRLLHDKPGAEKPVLGIGLANSLTTRLYNVEGLSVSPTGSVLKISKELSDPFALGKKLGVDFVIDGHILPIGGKTRVTVQLLDISAHSVLWAQQFDESEEDIFQLEDSISARVVESLISHLSPDTGEHLPPSVTAEYPVYENFAAQKRANEINSKRNETPSKEKATKKVDPVVSERETLLLQDQPKAKSAARKFLPALIIVAALIIGLPTLYFLWQKPTEPKTIKASPAKSLVILPFTDETGFAGSLGTGLAEALTSRLGIIRQLSVRPASAGRALAGTVKDAKTIGRELGAAYVLRGTLKNTGDTSIVAELVNTADGATVFSEKLDASNNDLLGLQIRLAEKVLQTLKIEPQPRESERLVKRHTNDNLAYELYLLGRFQMANRSVDNLKRAAETFSRAQERDPNFALAYVGLADAYALLNLYQIPPPAGGYEKARQNAEKALALDDSLAEAHASLAYVKFYGDHDRLLAESEFRQAIELNPSYATAHHWFSLALSAMNRPEDAIKEGQTAQELDPSSAIIKTATAMAYFYGRQYENALVECEKALQIDPGFVPAHKTMRWIYQATGNFRNALAAFQKERSFVGEDESHPGWTMVQAQVEAIGGSREAAQALLQNSLKSQEIQENPSSYGYEIALAFTALDDVDNALLWLEKSKNARGHSFNFAHVDPRLEKLRKNERFIALTRELR